MENKKVQIVNMANGRVGINIPELHFKRVWEKRDAKINVDLDILKEIIYDTGVRNMFEQGILYIEDMCLHLDILFLKALLVSLLLPSILPMKNILMDLYN